MNKILMSILFLVSTGVLAKGLHPPQEVTPNPAFTLKKGEGQAKVSEKAIQQAKSMISDLYLKDAVTKIEGVHAVGIGGCHAFWVPKTLGRPIPAVALPDVRGVRIYFDDEDALKNFARAAMVLGSTISVRLPDDQMVDVPICGILQPAAVIRRMPYVDKE